jgi:hypothetical protein
MTIDKAALAALPLEQLRELRRLVGEVEFDRRCQSNVPGIGSCTIEPPHADGWHECAERYATGSPGYTSLPHRIRVRWRFDADVVEQEYAHEARRRPGAN